MKTKRGKFICIALTLLSVIYLVSFAALAYFGGYMTLASGQFRPFGFASADTWVWQPRYGTFYPFHHAGGQDAHMADAIGYFYSPLICATQHSIRPSMPFIHADGSGASPYPRFPSRAELHPLMQTVVSNIERDLHISWDHPETQAQTK